MGKASSTKKVARAARTGGKQTSQKRNLGFPALLIGVVVLGIALVAFAVVNNRAVSANTDRPRAQGQGGPSDHWHDAFGVDICGQFQPAVSDRADDAEGIHTHGDGVIHIHPFGLRSSGPRATLGRFFEDIGMTVTTGGIKMPDGKVYKVGETTCNGAPGVVSIAHWKNAEKAAGTKPDKVYTSGFDNVKLTENGGAFTVAFLPKGAVPEPPDSAAKLKELGAVDSGQTSSNATTGAASTGAASTGAASTGAVDPSTTGTVDPTTTGATTAGATTGATGAVDPTTTGATATGGDASTAGTTPSSSTP